MEIILEKIFKQIFLDQSEVLLHSLTNSRSAYKLLARKMQVMVSPNSDWSTTVTKAVLMAVCSLMSVCILTCEVTAVSSAGSRNCPHKALTIDSRDLQVITLPLTSDQRLYCNVKIIKMHASPRRYPPLGVGIF